MGMFFAQFIGVLRSGHYRMEMVLLLRRTYADGQKSTHRSYLSIARSCSDRCHFEAESTGVEEYYAYS